MAKVILSAVATFALVFHHATYQYTHQSDPRQLLPLACDRLLAVFADVIDVLNTHLSTVATQADE